MKIVSKISDYYDVELSYGIDKKLRLERETKKLKERERTTYSFEFKKDYKNYILTIHENIIGFWGEIYPFVGVRLYLVIKKIKSLCIKRNLR